MSVSSDPNRWLLSFYAVLRSRPSFATFAPSIQFEHLAQAVEREHPSKGAAMREWSVAAQHMLLAHLSSMHDQKETGDPVELWRVCKGDRLLACLAVYLTHGVDVRLMEREDFRRTQLCKDALEVEALSHKWRTALLAVGWIATS